MDRMGEKTVWKALQLTQLILSIGCVAIYLFLHFNGPSTIHYLSPWCIAMGALMLLPAFELIKDSEDWRFTFLLAQTIAVCLACMFAGFRCYPILFVLLSAKASTMLSGRKLHILLSSTALGFVFAIEFGLAMHFHGPSTPNQSLFVRLLGRIEAELAAVVAIGAVGLLGSKLISEQKARRLAEQLTKEIQNMTLALERSRIAQDMHDKLGHTLTSLGIQLELATKFLQTQKYKEAEETLATAQKISAESFAELRRAIQAIRDDFDFNEAVNQLTERVGQEPQQLKVQLDMDTLQLPLQSKHELFCIVQECLTNVQKHSHATEVKVSVKNDNGKIKLTVEDNGVGLRADHKSSGGFGIKGMMERASSVGGKMEICKAAARGTIVRVTVPG